MNDISIGYALKSSILLRLFWKKIKDNLTELIAVLLGFATLFSHLVDLLGSNMSPSAFPNGIAEAALIIVISVALYLSRRAYISFLDLEVLRIAAQRGIDSTASMLRPSQETEKAADSEVATQRDDLLTVLQILLQKHGREDLLEEAEHLINDIVLEKSRHQSNRHTQPDAR